METDGLIVLINIYLHLTSVMNILADESLTERDRQAGDESELEKRTFA